MNQANNQKQPASVSEIIHWQILNETTLALSKAETIQDIISIAIQNLNKMGYHVAVGVVDPSDNTIILRHLSFASQPATLFHPLKMLESVLQNYTFHPSQLGAYQSVLEKETVTYASFSLQQFLDFLKVDPASLAGLQPEQQPVTCIMAPIQANRVITHLFFITAATISPDDVPRVTAFVNLISMTIANHTLLRNSEGQKHVAQTLQKVSRIVGSTLELDTVLTLILEQLATVIPYDSSSILLEAGGNTLKLEAGRGFDQPEAVLDVVVPIDTNVLYQEIKRTKKPISIGDVRYDDRYDLWAGTSLIRSWIGVPLTWKDEVIGQISVDSFTLNAFNLEEVEIVFTFAQHVASAIQNARLYHQVTQKASELRALLDSARDVASTLDAQKVIYLMASRVKELMQANLALVYLLNTQPDSLSPVVTLDDLQQPQTVLTGQSVARQAITARRGLIFSPAAASDDSQKQLEGAVMVVPFMVREQAVGAIIMRRPGDTVFKQSDLDLLTRFALQTGIAIENSRLYAQVERRLKRENMLNQLSRRLSSKLSLNALAEDIMATTQTITEAESAALILLDPANTDTFLQFSLNVPLPNIPSQITTVPGIATHVMELQKVVIANPEQPYASPPWFPLDFQGVIAVPLTSGDEPWGVLGLFNRAAPFKNSGEIMNTLEAIGRQTGVAIENALLFQQVNDYAHNLAQQVEARTAEIRSQKEQTDAILASAADAIIITSADGMIQFINPAFTTLTGYYPDEVVGKTPRLLKSKETTPQTHRQLWKIILGGKVWRGSLKNKRKDGSLYDADLTISPIFNQHGQVEKFVGIQRDISKLRELDRLKTEFLGTAAHELRGPLTTIRGYAELLLARGDFTPAEIKKFIGYIHEQSVQLSMLVSDLLDVSKIESGAAFKISAELINPKTIIERTISHWQARSTKHTVKLIPPDSWAELKVDPGRLEQALNNLISNAIKYSPDNTDVTVSVNVTAANMRISVSDQGIGMTLEEQKHVFEKFWRADASSTAVEGTGLGMVIVKHIIELHGGKIWLSSRKGEGTTVSFTLPLTTGIATILVIEDEPSILEMQERLLAIEGYHVLTAKNGKHGLDIAIKELPDLIILDLMLPEMTGEDVLRHLKSNPSTQRIPVVVVSAKSGLAHIEHTFSLGAVDFLTKPYDIDEYLGRIKIAHNKN